MTQEITIEEYKQIYIRAVKKEGIIYSFFINIVICVLYYIIIGRYEAFAIILFLILTILSLIRHYYNFNEIKENFTNIEIFKETYEKLIKNIAKRNFLILLGIYALFLIILGIYNFLLHRSTPGESEGYSFLFAVFVSLSILEFFEYKEKISKESFKKIEASVDKKIKSLKKINNIS